MVHVHITLLRLGWGPTEVPGIKRCHDVVGVDSLQYPARLPETWMTWRSTMASFVTQRYARVASLLRPLRPHARGGQECADSPGISDTSIT